MQVQFVGGRYDGLSCTVDQLNVFALIIWKSPDGVLFFRLPPPAVYDRIARGETTKRDAGTEGRAGGWPDWDVYAVAVRHPDRVEYHEAAERYAALGSPELPRHVGCSGHRGPRETVRLADGTARERQTWTVTFNGPAPTEYDRQCADRMAPPRADRPDFRRDAVEGRTEGGNLVVTITDSWRA